MNFNELEEYLRKIPEKILDDAPEMIAETATTYFKETFTKKAFDGNPWEPAKISKNTGSLLVDSGALANSIGPALISRRMVVISAGNDKASYAKAHNEGFQGLAYVPEHSRKTKKGETQVKAHERNVDLPQRQFLGKSDELAKQVHDQLEGHLNNILNK